MLLNQQVEFKNWYMLVLSQYHKFESYKINIYSVVAFWKMRFYSECFYSRLLYSLHISTSYYSILKIQIFSPLCFSVNSVIFYLEMLNVVCITELKVKVCTCHSHSFFQKSYSSPFSDGFLFLFVLWLKENIFLQCDQVTIRYIHNKKISLIVNPLRRAPLLTEIFWELILQCESHRISRAIFHTPCQRILNNI